MKNFIKFLYICILFSESAYAGDKKWYDAESLRCYRNQDEFLRTEYGGSYKDDENIVIKKLLS
ncbi:hypothetical protein [Iodobacter ciconiae]|uniref:Uncharacterized protein n=1 Tax=Iodobacter ciconiae TaxID=2496266 RepID=A0A3S8ZWL2_9NEIS|nr:hypothetical protein [Iodobacter ciconiae]AZN37890.1 hypothetical protein EJO50_16310 [Iodobacter ciconiae]